MKKKALITGIGGQDGSYLAEYLIKKNYDVYGILPRRSSPELQTHRIDHILKKIKLVYGDILDQSNINDVFIKIKPDEVYHLAAQSHVGISFIAANLTTQIDYIGTLNVLEAFRKYSKNSKFYNASSSEMFGNINAKKMLNEKSLMDPASPYAIAKLASYHLTKVYRKSYGLFAVNGILFNHESERRGLNFVTAKIVYGALAIKYKIKKKLELGNLDASRDWGYAGDYVQAMWLMLQQKKPRDFVVATGQTKTVRQVCEYVFKKIGLYSYKRYVTINKKFMRPNELYHLNGDSKKIKKLLGWKPKITFEQLLDEMIIKIESRFFKKNI
jgi:GDPmannose 4,6-dehydratase